MAEDAADTEVGVEDPYDYADVCDFLADDGRCRYAVEFADRDPEFAADRRAEDFRCPAADPAGAWDWRDCPKFRSTTAGEACLRCGLEERRDAHGDGRPLIEEHHLVYPDDRRVDHEVTVALCRWCHAKVHDSWATLADDATPAPAALAERESRRGSELSEFDFETAAERRDDDA